MEWLRRIAASGVTHVLFAFVAMGGWAYFANSGHPMPKPLVAGLVQGTMSACLTLFLKTTIDRLAGMMTRPLSLWAPPAVACTASAAILATIHKIAGTPEILTTIAVPLLVATSYGFIYNFARRRSVHG